MVLKEIGRCLLVVIFAVPTIYALLKFNENYQRKDFDNIKKNGTCFTAKVIEAKFYMTSAARSVFTEARGEITVVADNIKATLMNINYNDDFKKLEEMFLDSGKQQKEITVKIYMLNHKVIADFETLVIN